MSFVKRTYKHALCVLILLGFLALSVFVYRDVFFRTIEAIRDFATSIAYYFCVLFYIKNNLTPTVTLMPSLGIEVPLPDDWQGVVSKSGFYWKSMLNGETYSHYFLGVGNGFASFCQILLLLLPLFFLVIYLFHRAISNPNNDYNHDSKPLRAWKSVSHAVYEPTRDWLRSFVEFIRDTGRGVYWKIGLVIWLYNLNIFTILIELFAFLFYFFSSFDFATLYVQVYRLVLDLTLTFRALPWYVWVPVLLPLFQLWRHKFALDRQRAHEAHNKTLRDELPVSSLIVGSMGTGKTTHLVDLALSVESDFRAKAYEIMLKCDVKFPDFPWLLFEKTLQAAMLRGTVFNLASARRQVDSWESNFDLTMQRCECFGYDFERYGLTNNDGLIVSSLFDVLKTYAQAYFIYVVQSSLLVANLSIRTDGQFCDAGNLPIWDFDFFSRDPALIEAQSRHAHILNWDVLRLGRKFVPENPAAYGLEFGVFDITEFAKDRGNQHETAGLKKKDDSVNQLNDRFNWALKTCRHAATVDNFPFFKLLSDDQREDSAPADLVQLMTIVSIGRKKGKGLTFPFFSLEGLLFDLYYAWFSRNYTRYRFSRGDNTLVMYMLHKFAAWTHGYVVRTLNRYGYTKSSLALTDGKNDTELQEHRYYLADKKIYSKRFDTACYRDFFARRALASGVGLDDIPEYATETAALEEMQQQNSYMIKELDASTQASDVSDP